MKNTRVGQILNSLMAEKNIRVAELARLVNLPQPTVHRIATGVCEHPHLSSLQPLADFFELTVDQLKGHEPIQVLDFIAKVPLISWDEAQFWPANKKELINNQKVITDARVGPLAYALKVKDASMDPVFPIHTILIADPERPIRDRSYVLAKLDSHPEPVFRQLLMNAGDKHLKPLSPDLECYKMTTLNNNDKILSAIIQAKRDCEGEMYHG